MRTGGGNNPTGNLGFSPMLITLFAPFAFFSRAWLSGLITAVVVFVFLVVVLFFKHANEVAATKEEKRREAMGMGPRS